MILFDPTRPRRTRRLACVLAVSAVSAVTLLAACSQAPLVPFSTDTPPLLLGTHGPVNSQP